MPRNREVIVLDVEHLKGLHDQGRLQLRPDFQRNAIWPIAAKSYLIDTIIQDRPVPLLFLQPMTSPQSGMAGFAVVDGQQRLSAIFDYVDGRFRLSGPDVRDHRLTYFNGLPRKVQEQILGYGMAAEVLRGYSQAEIKEVYVRLNKYGVRLSQQELRYARGDGAFKKAAESLGANPFWLHQRFVTPGRDLRMRSDELAAEFLILLAEGAPQDKKATVDQYYVAFEDNFPDSDALVKRLEAYIDWVSKALGDQPRSRFRKPVDLYSLVGAIDRLSHQSEDLAKLDAGEGGRALAAFAAELTAEFPSRLAAQYLLAASRQTDNLNPRRTRIEVLSEVLSGRLK